LYGRRGSFAAFYKTKIFIFDPISLLEYTFEFHLAQLSEKKKTILTNLIEFEIFIAARPRNKNKLNIR